MAEENASDSKQILFFVKNAQYNTKSLEVYLARRGFDVYSESTLNESVEKIKELKPNYVFVAWDHKTLNVQELLAQLQAFTEIVIVPFITSTSTTDNSRLAQVDAPVKLFPPISGPSVQRLLLKYEKEIANKTAKKGNLISAAKSQGDKNTVVTSKGSVEGNAKQVYVSKGQKLAELAKMAQAAPSLLLPDDLDESANAKSFFDSITDLTVEPATVQFSRNHHVKISDSQKHAARNVFEKTLKNELTEVIETVKENSAEKKLSTYGVLIQSIDCSGVVVLQSEWNIQLDEAEPALASWARELTFYLLKKQAAESVNFELFQSPTIEINLPEHINIFDSLEEKSAVHKELMIDDRKTVLAFFDMHDNPFNIEPLGNPNYLSVIHACFSKSTKVPFDVYLELKENKKILKYIKAETEISEKEINSLKEKKDVPLLIESHNELAWYKYGLESFFLNL